SLRSLFPDVKSACVTAVITHDLEAADLYKLDIRVKDAEPTYSLSAAGTFEMNMSKHRAYKSILSPLHTYFTILSAHLPNQPAPTYEWAAVLEYHTLFFNRRRNDMLAGSYDGWGASDIGLLSSYVYPHRKQISITPKGAGTRSSCPHVRALPQLQCWQMRKPLHVEMPPHLLLPRLWEGPPADAHK
ncbi:hypothetical protein B0H13DRAFT_1641828, partial [Mycena leptocephala]